MPRATLLPSTCKRLGALLGAPSVTTTTALIRSCGAFNARLATQASRNTTDGQDENHHPLAASTHSFKELNVTTDLNRFIHFPQDRRAELLPESNPAMTTEFNRSGTEHLLVRGCFFRLQQLLLGNDANNEARSASPQLNKKAVLLEGRQWSGKSVLLACAVAWLREHGWLCLYLPDASDLVRDSDFKFNPDADAYDAPLAAQRMVLHLAAPNHSMLSSLPCKLQHSDATVEAREYLLPTIRSNTPEEKQPRSGSIAELAQLALSELHEEGLRVSDICLDVLQEMKSVTEKPVLLAVDCINALSWDSGFYEVPNDRGLANIQAGEFRHVEAIRDMRSPPANGAYLAATSRTAGVSSRRQVRDVPKGARRTVSRFNLHETAAALANYQYGEQAKGLRDHSNLDERMARYLHRLSCGNAGELKYLYDTNL